MPSTAAITNAVRQLDADEIKEPRGRLTTVATEIPAVMKDVARMTDVADTSRPARPAPIAQKPPRAIPSNSREPSNMGKLTARAPTMSASTSNTVRDQMTVRRSIREVSTVTTGELTAAARPVATTIRPAVPIPMSRSLEMAGNSPIGRNSESTSTKDPSATEITPSHPRRSELFLSGAFAGEPMSATTTERLINSDTPIRKRHLWPRLLDGADASLSDPLCARRLFGLRRDFRTVHPITPRSTNFPAIVPFASGYDGGHVPFCPVLNRGDRLDQ